jgi:pyruvate,water dikinase
MKGNNGPKQSLISELHSKSRKESIGNKAVNIQALQRLGMRVPVTHVLHWEAYQRYMANDVPVIAQIQAELRAQLDATKRYAVRSSANIEDQEDHSFAGQFKTVLEVQGEEPLLQAIWSVWATALTPEVDQYLQRRNLQTDSLRMAVILQEMVEPVFSGVVFSRNPMTGARETVIEAVAGQGTALVQEGVTPYRWIYRRGQYTQRPAAEADVPTGMVQRVVDDAQRLAKKLQRDIDLEWVYDGREVYWVQMREITSLRSVQVYSNAIAQEMIPGMIKPLIWSINVPMICEVWIRIMTSLIGPNAMTPEQLARPFYYRAYFNMGLLGQAFERLGFPPDALEMMWGLTGDVQENADPGAAPSAGRGAGMRPSGMRGAGMKMPDGMAMGGKAMRVLPRAARFLWQLWRLANRLPNRLATMEAAYRSIDRDAVRRLSAPELLASFDRLYRMNQEAAYYNIVIPLTMYALTTIFRKQLTRSGYDFQRLDLHLNAPDFLRYQPNHSLEQLHHDFQQFSTEQQQSIRQARYADLRDIPEANVFATGMERLLQFFGHLSDSGNDFSAVPWREMPDQILKLVIDFAPRSGGEDRFEGKVAFNTLRLPWARRWFLSGLYARVRAFHLHREHISYVYTLGYGLFRVHFLAIAHLLVRQGVLNEPEDIFYLTIEEVRAAVDSPPAEQFKTLRDGVAQRKLEMENARCIICPPVIFGDTPPPPEPKDARVLKGTPTSRGYCTGPVRVVTGLQDFNKVLPGDVLVIPFSDVGWTPLFARASGVIAESGGMLSHSSIVAREYGIPAVVSVPGACQLADGTPVTVDAFTGHIFVLTGEQIAPV